MAACVKDAQHERVLVTRNGRPVALIVGVEGMDEEQVQLASSNEFWTLISERRAQKTISRAELEKRIRRKRTGRSTAA
jgi:antitoxin (DNA-binding transcriptional repressor) of toxin-antitoxin stability system